jgi:hypothetical protein
MPARNSNATLRRLKNYFSNLYREIYFACGVFPQKVGRHNPRNKDFQDEKNHL